MGTSNLSSLLKNVSIMVMPSTTDSRTMASISFPIEEYFVRNQLGMFSTTTFTNAWIVDVQCPLSETSHFRTRRNFFDKFAKC